MLWSILALVYLSCATFQTFKGNYHLALFSFGLFMICLDQTP
jgi:hypothetical protein